MIRQLSPTQKAQISHTTHLRATLHSLFRFQDNRPLPPPDEIDITTISYINYKKISEMVTSCLSVIHSEVVTIDPSSLKDIVFIVQLALERTQYKINLNASRIDYFQEMLEEQPPWKQYWRWGRVYEAHERLKKLLENESKWSRIQSRLKQHFEELQRSIRQAALAVVKSESDPQKREHLTNIESLEETRGHLWRVLTEIEQQTLRVQENKRIVFYEVERSRIFNGLMRMKLVLDPILSQLQKSNLDTGFISPEMMGKLRFEGKQSLRWRFSDRHVFQHLTSFEAPLRLMLEGLDRVLQTESLLLNIEANQVIGIHSLIHDLPEVTAGKREPTILEKVNELESSMQNIPALSQELKALLEEDSVEANPLTHKTSSLEALHKLSMKASSSLERFPFESLSVKKDSYEEGDDDFFFLTPAFLARNQSDASVLALGIEDLVSEL
ncbi:hypothetical protein WDW89_10075 [Deltaproteobacteria bacterium TL4]